MRTIVFFDLPNVYSNDKREYSKFRKFLIKEGFVMMQESVYSKIVLNSQQIMSLIVRIRKHAPKKGIVQVMNVTEKQYSQIELITGEVNTKIINNDDCLVIL